MTATAPLEKGILSVRELLGDGRLEIPLYHRPYKWAAKNISQLFADIALHKDKTAYRLGTVVGPAREAQIIDIRPWGSCSR